MTTLLITTAFRRALVYGELVLPDLSLRIVPTRQSMKSLDDRYYLGECVDTSRALPTRLSLQRNVARVLVVGRRTFEWRLDAERDDCTAVVLYHASGLPVAYIPLLVEPLIRIQVKLPQTLITIA